MTDSGRVPISRLTFSQVVETSSLWTAGSFVISGFMNAALFWLTFRMNYFTIATPTDIVMSGFLYVSFVAVVAAALTFTLTVSGAPFLRETVFLIAFILNKFSFKNDGKSFERKQSLVLWSIITANKLILAIFLIISIFANFIESATVARFFGFTPKPVIEYWEQKLTSNPASHLYLASDDDNAAKCGIAPVIWMGSSSVLLNCRGRLRVIHNTENLSLERHPPKDRAILDILQRPLPYLPKPPKLAEGNVQR